MTQKDFKIMGVIITPVIFWCRAGGRVGAEFSIIPHPALFVNRQIAQRSPTDDPEFCIICTLDFFKNFCYNYYIK